MAKKKLIQDSTGQIFPITTADAVYLSDGSKTLKKYVDDELNNLHSLIGSGDGSVGPFLSSITTSNGGTTTSKPSHNESFTVLKDLEVNESDIVRKYATITLPTITKQNIEEKLTGTITSHTHDYLPLTGGKVTGTIQATSAMVASTFQGNLSGNAKTASNLVILERNTAADSPNTVIIGNKNFGIAEYTSSCSDLPTSNYYHITTALGSSSSYITQIANGADCDGLYYRNKKGGTWGSWNKVALASHTHDYLPLTGGTIAGDVTIDSDLSVSYGTTTVDTLVVNAVGNFNDDISVKSGQSIYVGGNEVLNASNYTDYVPKSSNSKYTDTYVWTDSDNITKLGTGIHFVDGTFDQYGQTCGISAWNNTDVNKLAFYCWGHWNSADIMASWDLGAEGWEWGTGHIFYGIVEGSDRNTKENIYYIKNNEMNMLSGDENEERENAFTYSDFYNFVKDDLELATFNFIGQQQNKLGFIAQDLLYNPDGTDNKIGQYIVPPIAALTAEEIEEKKAEFIAETHREPTSEELEIISTPKLKYIQSNYISTLAGALKEAINKIESLEARIKELENNN